MFVRIYTISAMLLKLYFFNSLTYGDEKVLLLGSFFGVNIDGDTLIPAVDMALQHINSDSSILTGYTLKHTWRDSKCNSASAIRAMLNLTSTPPRKIAFLGPGCSVASEPVAEAAPFWSIVQMGYSTSSPQFSDKRKFPLYFRTSASDNLENPARIAVLKKFGWTRVALLVENYDIFVLTKEDLVQMLKSSNITIIATETFKNDPSTAFLKEKDARIVIALMYEDKFRKAMCKVYKEQLYGHKYVWITMGWYNEGWWAVKDTDCSTEQVRTAAVNIIDTFPLPLSNSHLPTVSNRTADELNTEYKSWIKEKNMSYNLYASFAYDSVYSLALMFNRSIPMLRAQNKSLEGLEYGDNVAAEIFVDILKKTSFWGMSGHVTFDKNGNRETITTISQRKNGKKTMVATYENRNHQLKLLNSSFQWEGGRVPRSGFLKIRKMYTAGTIATVTFLGLSSCGMLLCCVCLWFNYRYRKSRFIKMSSPNFNNITAVGCMLCYLEVFVMSYSRSAVVANHRLMCHIWVITTGFSLAFGAMFAKTWRVYKIFTNGSLQKELGKLDNKFLYLKLFLYWMMDVTILSVWELIDSATSEIRSIEEQVSVNDEDVVINLLARQCTSKYYLKWMVGLCVYKGILLLFGVFLAWQTRNVQYSALNDSKNIAVAVYNVFMFSTLSIVAEFAISSTPSRALLTEIIVLISTTSTMAIVFGPKIIHIRGGQVDVTDTSEESQAT